MASKYTISQALRRIKKLKGELAQQNERVKASILYDKKDPPAFSYAQAVKARNEARTQLITLSTAVAVANANNTIEHDGMTLPLACVLRMLQEIKAQLAEYKALPMHSLQKERETVRESVTEEYEDVTGTDGEYKGQRRVKVVNKVTIVCEVTQAEWAEKVAKLEREFEDLNDKLERANHTVAFDIE